MTGDQYAFDEKADRLKAALEIDKIEYQRLQQEIYFRMQARSMLLRSQLTLTGFAALIAAPGAAFLLKSGSGNSSDQLLNFAVTLSIALAMCLFSLVLFYEMLNHDRYVIRAASYMHSVIRPRMQALTKTPQWVIAAEGRELSFGAMDWELFLARWYERALPPESTGANWLAHVFSHLDAWLRGETISIMVAAVALGTAGLLIGTNFNEIIWGCHFDDINSCTLITAGAPYKVGIYNGLVGFIEVLIVFACALFVVIAFGFGALFSVRKEFHGITKIESSRQPEARK